MRQKPNLQQLYHLETEETFKQMLDIGNISLSDYPIIGRDKRFQNRKYLANSCVTDWYHNEHWLLFGWMNMLLTHYWIWMLMYNCNGFESEKRIIQFTGDRSSTSISHGTFGTES